MAVSLGCTKSAAGLDALRDGGAMVALDVGQQRWRNVASILMLACGALEVGPRDGVLDVTRAEIGTRNIHDLAGGRFGLRIQLGQFRT
ncbi:MULTISPECIES: hypothetical protein [unclassified Bradyrhizobium]|uniref:hypothetical protein n=1 Tax=unclassified Bradyrhizobium TaxID=2631580 RepID=UPI0024E0D9FF|nr:MULTISPECIES: hypothetical protein [unclassified Bradyrhizobium]